MYIYTFLNRALLTSASVIFAALFNACTHSAPQNAAPSQTNKIKNVRLIYSANVAAEVEPCGCRTNPSGGLFRRLNLTESKLRDRPLLSLDSGDLFYKTAPTPAFLRPQYDAQATAVAKAYNILGIDVATVGELDFASGVAQLQRTLTHTNTKFVSANIKSSDGRFLFERFVVLERGGVRFGIFGLLDESIPITMPENSITNGITVEPHLNAAHEVIAILAPKVDVIIALTHLGLEADRLLAQREPRIDFIFGAHSQSFLMEPERVGTTAILHSSIRGQHLGVLEAENGQLLNRQFQLDSRFDSPAEAPNILDNLARDLKLEIAELNKQQTDTFLNSPPNGLMNPSILPESTSTATAPTKIHREVQTMARCAECHTPQFDFYRKTPHGRSYMTLVQKQQQNNLACLKCHSVGLGTDFHNVKGVLQFHKKTQKIEPEVWAKQLHNMPVSQFSKVKKAYLNVQCENCHKAGDTHPFAMGEQNKLSPVSSNTCLVCHTREQAPGWYQADGKPDQGLISKKLKEMSCPKL